MLQSTNINVSKRLQKQYNLYQKFFPFCPPESQDKMLRQMLIMREQIRRIGDMDTANKNAFTYIKFEIIGSKLNYQENDN